MADDIAGGEGTPPDLNALAKDHVDQLYDVRNLGRLERAIANAVQTAIVNSIGAIITAAGGVGMVVAKAIEAGEQVAAPILAPLMATMIQSAFGIEVDERSLARIRDAVARHDLGRAMGATVLGGLHQEGGELQPSQAPAEKLIGMLAHLAIDSWAEGTIVEWIVSLSGMLHELEGLTKLAPAVVQATGLDELGRVALRPLATVTVATPLTWAANKQYRPNLLSEGEIIKAFQRGDYAGGEAAEELARLGYSNRRQDMLIKSAAKRLSLDDALTLVREGAIDRDYALANLKDEGYDDATAQYAVVAAESKRTRSLLDDSLAAVNNAYINRDLTDSQFSTFLPGIIADETERGIHETTARTRRDLNVKHLSHGEVLDCVELAILPTAYYRDWLKREGYPEAEATALELRLIAKRDKQADLEAERRRIDEEKAAEKLLREQEKADRLAAVAAEHQLAARGSIADLQRAVVRGLIPIDRLVEVLRAHYDEDTVGILVALAESDRVAYVGNQEAAKRARERATARQIDVGALEQGVLTGVLTIAQFRAALTARQFAAGDIDILSATLAARKQDLDDARTKRAQAERDAKVRHIDLGRAERLVRRGAHTFAEYDALLTTFGYDEGSRAAMVELVRLEAADDAEARRLRDEAQKRAATKGLSLEQFRRAVLLGVRTVDDFGSYLAAQGYTSDASSVLLAELRRDVADADAARQRREATAATGGAVGLAFARVTQAARLGLISPAAYQARLTRAGWAADDITIEMDLLLVEIADTQAARARRQQLAEQLDAAKALSLAQLERAVKLGTATIADYQSAAAAIYEPADVDLLVATLQAELDALATAAERRATIDGELTARQLSLGQLEAAVKAGALSLLDFRDRLITWGYGLDDAQLLTALLANAMDRSAGAPGG